MVHILWLQALVEEDRRALSVARSSGVSQCGLQLNWCQGIGPDIRPALRDLQRRAERKVRKGCDGGGSGTRSRGSILVFSAAAAVRE
jgi:hypothetical protein